MPSDLCTALESPVAFEILAYLAEKPQAGDTPRGIAEWWLLERKIEYQIAKINEALAELVAKRLVLEYTGRDSRTHYRINQHKNKEIQTLLKQRLHDIGPPD